MKEVHGYKSTPEPGFEERLYEAVGRYFVRLPNSHLTVFREKRIFIEHPDLGNNEEFMAIINQIAEILYDHHSPNR